MAPLPKIATIESLHADAGQRTEWGLYYSDIRRLGRGRRHGRGLKYMALGKIALMLWGFALENLAKSIVIHREQASLPTDRLAPALSKHKTLELLLRSGIPLTTREQQLVKRLEMAVNWPGRISRSQGRSPNGRCGHRLEYTRAGRSFVPTREGEGRMIAAIYARKRGGGMKAKGSATLADVKLVLTAPGRTHTKRKGFEAAQITFLLAKQAFKHRATATTWADTVEKARRLHAEYRRVREARDAREREAAASRAATDEGGQA